MTGRKKSGAKSVVKSYRLSEDFSEKLDKITTTNPSIGNQQIMTDALEMYFDKHLSDAEKNIAKMKDINTDETVQEYMFVPADYYAQYNNLTKIDVDQLLKSGKLKHIVIDDVTLVMIEVSENIFKKAELIAIKSNVTNVMKEVHDLRLEVKRLRKLVEKEGK